MIINYRGGNADAFFASAPRHVLRMLAGASLRVTPSKFLFRVFSRYGLSAEVVPNIIDLSRFVPARARMFGDAPHLVVTRNLEPIYDIPTAIRAFARIRDDLRRARLTIAGTGPELSRLEALVADLGLQTAVSFTGRIANADIPALYASADCLLNPSTVDNMPVSILEAFASGVPVVSTCAGGIPDLVEQGVSGLLLALAKTSERLSLIGGAQKKLAQLETDTEQRRVHLAQAVADYRAAADLGQREGIDDPYPILSAVVLEELLGKKDAQREAALTRCEALAQARFKDTRSVWDAITIADVALIRAIMDQSLLEEMNQIVEKYRAAFTESSATQREHDSALTQMRFISVMLEQLPYSDRDVVASAAESLDQILKQL